jgi:hypothetical protein
MHLAFTRLRAHFVRYVRCLPLYFSASWLYEFSIAILPFLLSHSIKLCYPLSWIVNGPILVHSQDFQNAVLRTNQWKTNKSLTQQHLPSLYPWQATLSCEIIIKPLISKAWIELSRSKLKTNLIKLRQYLVKMLRSLPTSNFVFATPYSGLILPLLTCKFLTPHQV